MTGDRELKLGLIENGQVFPLVHVEFDENWKGYQFAVDRQRPIPLSNLRHLGSDLYGGKELLVCARKGQQTVELNQEGLDRANSFGEQFGADYVCYTRVSSVVADTRREKLDIFHAYAEANDR